MKPPWFSADVKNAFAFSSAMLANSQWRLSLLCRRSRDMHVPRRLFARAPKMQHCATFWPENKSEYRVFLSPGLLIISLCFVTVAYSYLFLSMEIDMSTDREQKEIFLDQYDWDFQEDPAFAEYHGDCSIVHAAPDSRIVESMESKYRVRGWKDCLPTSSKIRTWCRKSKGPDRSGYLHLLGA